MTLGRLRRFSSKNWRIASGAGYAAGGSDTTAVTDKFLFSNDSRSTLGTGLSVARRYPIGIQSSKAGYVGGGDTGDSSAPFSVIDKFLFSNDSRTTLSSGLSQASSRCGGVSSFLAGYFAGGWAPNTGVRFTFIDKITYVTDSRTTLSSSFNVGNRSTCGISSKDFGYFMGGSTASGLINTSQKLNLYTESIALTGRVLTLTVGGGAGLTRGGAYGYHLGGAATGSPNPSLATDSVDRLLFNVDTYSNMSPLPFPNTGVTGTFSSATHGYIVGGFTGGSISTVTKFNYSTETASTAGTTSSVARYSPAGFSSPDGKV